MVLAANVLVAFERRGQVVGGRGWRSVPPQAEVHGLFSKQRLDQRQVQARYAPAVQHQDLIAWTQTWGHRRVCCRKEEVKATQIIHGMLFQDYVFSEQAPSLNASPSGSTSLTKILLFLWLSMCPVTAKPGGRKRNKDGGR